MLNLEASYQLKCQLKSNDINILCQKDGCGHRRMRVEKMMVERIERGSPSPECFGFIISYKPSTFSILIEKQKTPKQGS